MTNINQKLISLILKNKTINQIAEELGLSHKEIHRRLIQIQKNGYLLDEHYYETGDISYSQQIDNKPRDTNTITLNLDDDTSQIKIMIISDIHTGNELENLNLLNIIYNYCIINDIHIIINLGDLIDGTSTKGTQKITNVEK